MLQTPIVKVISGQFLTEDTLYQKSNIIVSTGSILTNYDLVFESNISPMQNAKADQLLAMSAFASGENEDLLEKLRRWYASDNILVRGLLICFEWIFLLQPN